MHHTPLRVLYVSHIATPGGCANSLRYLIENLPAGMVEATVISPDGPAVETFRAAGARVIRIPAVAMLTSANGVPLRGLRNLELLRTAWFMRYGRYIRQAIREVKPDVVHLNERGMLQAARIAHREGIPVIAHARSVQDRRTRWLKTVSEYALNRYVSLVVPIDESVSFSIREVRRRQVIYNPLNLAKGDGVPPLASRTRPAGAPVRITYLSGLLGVKGVWDLLEATRHFRGRQDVVFQIAGENSRPPEFHRSLVGRLISLTGMARDVEAEMREWLEREQPTNIQMLGLVSDVPALLGRTDVLVFPSHFNGPGRSIFEAGIYGIPSIVALADKIEDVVQDGVTGLIVPQRDPGALATAIDTLVRDEAYRHRLGDEARRRYTEQFDPQRIGAAMLDAYRAVLAAPAPPAVSLPAETV